MLIDVTQYVAKDTVGRKVTEGLFAVRSPVPREFNIAWQHRISLPAKLDRELRNRRFN